MLPDRLFDPCQERFSLREESHERRKPVAKVLRLRGPHRERSAMPRAHVDPLRDEPARPAATDAADLVGCPLFAGRQLGHRGDNDVFQPRPAGLARREGREHPARTFVDHQISGAVDGIDDADKLGLRCGSSTRKRVGIAPFSALHHQFDGAVGRPVPLQPREDRLLTHLVDPVDRVGRRHRCHAGKRLGRLGVASCDQRVANRVLESAEQGSETVEPLGSHQQPRVTGKDVLDPDSF